MSLDAHWYKKAFLIDLHCERDITSWNSRKAAQLSCFIPIQVSWKTELEVTCLSQWKSLVSILHRCIWPIDHTQYVLMQVISLQWEVAFLASCSIESRKTVDGFVMTVLVRKGIQFSPTWIYLWWLETLHDWIVLYTLKLARGPNRNIVRFVL